MPAQASRHREAPFITHQPKVDGTDLYMFRSYEAGRQDFVTLMANDIPFQDPQGGPYFYQFDQNGLYEIHVDNVGDAKGHLTFQFRFKNTSKKLALPGHGLISMAGRFQAGKVKMEGCIPVLPGGSPRNVA